MSSNDRALETTQPTSIPNPDQLQQARRPDASAPRAVADQRSEPSTPNAGILGQLETERAHD